MLGDDDVRQLFLELNLKIHAFAAKRVPADRAWDIVSETFVVAWERRHQAPDPGKGAAWIFGIAKNKIRHETQRLQNDRDLVAIDQAQASQPEDIAEVVIRRDSSMRVLRQLTAQELWLFGLMASGIEPTLAASEMGISVSAYTTRVFRLRNRLRSLGLEARVLVTQSLRRRT